jgi:hypothetical protein
MLAVSLRRFGDFSGLVVWCRLDDEASEGGIRPTDRSA